MLETRSVPLSALELSDAVRQGRPADSSRLDRILGLDKQRGLLEVQAGTRWAGIATELGPRDPRAAAVRTTMPTVGESIARNAAGPDGRPAVAHVQALTLVMPDGELRRVSRNRHGDLFALVVGGQGLFATVYSVTLRVDTLASAVERASRPDRLRLRPDTPAARALELLIPPEALDAFVHETDARCGDWRIPLQGVEVRHTSGENDTYLRWACRDYVEVKLNFSAYDALGASVRCMQLRRELIGAAIAAGGRFHIACTPDATREQTEACYPQLKTFLAQKRRFDPDERLVSRWYLHQRSLLARESCEVRWAS